METFQQITKEIESEVDKMAHEDLTKFGHDFGDFLKESVKKYPHLGTVGAVDVRFSMRSKSNSSQYVGTIDFKGALTSFIGVHDIVTFFKPKVTVHYLKQYLSNLRKQLWQS